MQVLITLKRRNNFMMHKTLTDTTSNENNAITKVTIVSTQQQDNCQATPSHVFKTDYSDAFYYDWTEYTKDLSNGCISSETKGHKSFTQKFFHEHKLENYFDTNCQHILQFGVSTGEFLLTQKTLKRTAYDYVE